MDVSRTNLPQSLLSSLETDTHKEPAVYLLPVMLNTIAQQFDDGPSPPVQALLSLATAIYRVSARLNNDHPGDYAPPIDALRGFIHAGLLPANYRTEVEAALPAGAVLSASNGVISVLAAVARRPTTTLNLVVQADSFSDACTTLSPVVGGARKSLFDAAGRPFRFPDSFRLPAGTRVQVCGYSDLVKPCEGEDLEVISVNLDTLIVGSDQDGDGNLLVDSWERQFLARLGASAFADADGDGFQNLQEMFDGTDPDDASGHSPGAAL